jgi:signal transduction histidine kinase
MAYPSIVLRIEDNGIGFNVEKRLKDIVREKRMGLSSMQERVNLLGGHMRIRSEPHKGTRISIKLPIPTTGQ